MFLSLMPRVQFRTESFGGLAFVPFRAMIVELNKIGYRILETIAGKGQRSEEEILTDFSSEKQKSVQKFIDDMVRLAILQLAEEVRGDKPYSSRNIYESKETDKKHGDTTSRYAKYLLAPAFAWWDITKACNLQCKQCYSASGKVVSNELTTAEVFSVIEDFSENGMFYIYFLGGEPLLRPDFFDILRKCRDSGITSMMSTNGWFVDRKIAKKLFETDVQIVRVSIDGGTEEVHDKIRGVQGSFKRALKAVSLLKEAGVPNVGVSPTLLSDNYFQVDKIIELAIDHGADEVQVVQLCLTGRGENLRALTLEEFKETRKLVLESMSRHSDKLITATEGILKKQCEVCVSNRTAVPSFMGCTGGRSCIAVDEKGTVFPCILYRRPAGSLQEKRLADIWHNSPLFLSMREIKKECIGCAYSDVCARECPLVKDKITREKKEKFSQTIRKESINRHGCEKFISGDPCFIRF